MKKIFVTLAAVLAAVSAHAQFTLTHDGLVASGDRSKGYAVADIPGKSREEIFEVVENYVYSNFYYNGCTIDTLCYERVSVTVNYASRNDNTIVLKGPDFNHRVNADMMSYKITYRIKDGRLRMDVPQLNRFTVMSDGYISQGSIRLYPLSGRKYSLYGKNRRPMKNKRELISGIEQYFNRMFEEPVSLLTDENW